MLTAQRSSHSKVILITGCSSGFGMLIAARLASAGHIVYATMRDLRKKTLLVQETALRKTQVRILRLDVTDDKSIQEAMKTIAAEQGRLDVLINNAGYGIGGFFEDLTQEEIRAQMDTNFFGVQNVTRRVIPLMRPRRQGLILNISSVSGRTASPAFGAYVGSKWALEGWSESLHYEMRLFGIDVCLMEPGSYSTKIFTENRRVASRYHDPESPYHKYSQSLLERIMSYVGRLKRDPEDIAKLAEHIIDSRRRRLRYVPDLGSRVQIFLHTYLPFPVYRWLVWRALNLRPEWIEDQ